MSPSLQITDRHVSSPAKLRGEKPANPQPQALCSAITETVFGPDGRERGRAKDIAAALACPVGHVTDLADTSRRVALKAFEVPGLIRTTRCFAILDVLEAQVGRVAFQLPAATTSEAALQAELAENVQAFGRFLQTNAAAIADGVLQSAEAAQIDTVIDQLIAGLCEYKALVQTRVRANQAVSA